MGQKYFQILICVHFLRTGCHNLKLIGRLGPKGLKGFPLPLGAASDKGADVRPGEAGLKDPQGTSRKTTEGGSGNSQTNIVIWETGKCWNFFQNATDVCGEGGIRLKGERLNIERYVGAACNCDEYSLGFDGFNCPIQCDRKKDSKIMNECRQEHRECQINRENKAPFCGCPIGYAYHKVTGGKTNCQKVDSCSTCEHKCHKASKCLPGTSGSRTGYNCAPCNPKFGYRGDGFSCENIDECADDRLNDCDKPNAYCDDRDPVYDDGLKYECSCQEGWQGDVKGGYKWRPCKDTNECLNKTICGGNAICVNTPGSFICQCKDGFAKKPGSPRECEDINECMISRPCHQLAYCKNTPGSYECKCKEGYKGDGKKECLPDKDYWCAKCDKATTECVLSEKKDSYVCKCKKGFQTLPGENHRCEDIPNCRDPTLNDCDKTPGRATCADIPGSYYCNCTKNYEGNGKVCKPIDPCEISYPCANIAGTVCFNNNGKAECRCKNGFIRQINDQKNFTAPCFDIDSAPVNNCTICDNSTSICRPINKDQPFRECVCREGYRRNAAGKCVNINECLNVADNNCDDQAICIDRQPALHGKRFECKCKPGFEGIGTIDKCDDHDECKNKTLNICPNPITYCVNTVGSYSCECKNGYRKLKGREECGNINECEEGTASCPLMSKCIDLSPGYKCVCGPGFRNSTNKEGKMLCDDIDECKESVSPNKGSACDTQNGICKNTFGSYLCDCKKGFTIGYDGKSCIDKDECKLGTAICCPQVEECQNTIGSYKCNCRYGFIPDPKTGKCVDRDECKDGSNKCNKNSVCINTFASYKCVCEDGFQPKVGAHPLRPVCERQNVCAKYPRICEPGRCESTEVAPHYYKCHCPASAVVLNDTKCVFPNYCDKDFPCPKQAVCASGQCVCNVGYSWQEISRFPITIEALRNRPPCKEVNPCLEQQLCVAPLKCLHTGPGKFACQCQDGFELINGECFDIDECNIKEGAAKCPVNSHCKNLVGSYKCDCKIGFTAKMGSTRTSPNCIDENECEAGTHDCGNKNATCVNTIGSFECKCADGFRGQAPDYQICRDINECKEGTHTCAKDTSFCTNTDGGFDCKCKPGYYGDGETCLDIDECNPADPKHNCTETQECINMPGTFNCTCKPGFQLTPKGCEDINECLSLENNNCSKIGGEVRMKCINEPGSYSCVCPQGYAQISPEKCKDINECKQLPKVCPVFEADICTNTNGSFSCDCKPGYAKPKKCKDKSQCPCADIDECLIGIHVNGKFAPACGPSAKCENILGSHRCECAAGWEGNPYKEGCKIADACKVKNPCDKETEECVSAKQKAVCVCKKGFLITNNKKCQKNPCLVNRGGCGKSAQCVPIREEAIIKPVCKCKPGEKLNSDKECEKIDQCQCKTPVALGNPCHSKIRCSAEHMLCVNYGDSANCTCEAGYKVSKDHTACDNINECKEGVNANPKNLACDPQAHCADTKGSWDCECPRGQRTNFEHKCVVDTDCTKERGCLHDPNTYCKSINASHMWCECKNGFVGTGLARDGLCQPENHCVAAKRAANGKDVCPPNEHCVNKPDTYKCRCNKGFARDPKTQTCEDVNECALGIHECRTTYSCINTIGSYSCKCPLGYRENKTDSRCDDINECGEKLHNCTVPTERCINLPGSFKCECNEPNYIQTIRGCQDNNECDTNQFSCPEFSTCNNTIGGYECPCNKGFKAVKKEDGKTTIKCEDIDECLNPNTCPKNSKCKNLIGTFECICQPPTIQHGLQDCVANATCPECHKTAICLKSTRENGDVYNCTCSTGYRGDGIKSCEPINECTDGTAKCHKFASCIDETPLYRCQCNEPFEGDGKNICNLMDLCKKFNDCPTNTKCIPLDKKVEDKWVTCVCPNGFTFNNKTRQCDDIDECKKDPCPKKPEGVKCINTQGSYSCKCPEGFRLGGIQMSLCEDIDECLEVGSVICSKQGAKCVNTVGSFQCSCPKGMVLGKDNKTCNDIDECKEGKDDCDKETSTCRNTIGSFSCDCKKGLAKIPTKTNKCEDVNECELQLHNCKPYSELCHNTIGDFKCNCSNGYIRKEKDCVPYSDCEKSFECGANAFCVMRASRQDPSKKVPECVCQDGYYGINPKEFCDPVPDCEKDLQCPTNARCIETQVKDTKGRATYICECDSGYRKKGSQCEPINECLENENICNGTAICINLTPGFKCECPQGKIDIGIGKNNVTCAVPKCSDVKSPCHADAECLDNEFGFSCKCKKGFRGVGTAQLGCEVIDQCKEYIPCSQYATCVNQPRGAFTCTCRSGYEGNGTICHDVNECKNPKACDDQATCHNTQGSYNCQCNKGFTGTGLPGFCSDVDECADPKTNNCDLDTTICLNKVGTFECNCKNGYEQSKGSNRTCLDINECSNKTNPVCGVHKCSNIPGSYNCICNLGYTLSADSKSCGDINECDARPCNVQALCTNTPGSYSCICKEGYTGDGKTCTPLDKCSKPELNSCDKNTTICKQVEHSANYRCECKPGFIPPLNVVALYYNCIDEDECNSGKAKYDPLTQICTNTIGSYKITCKPGFEEDPKDKTRCRDHDECAEDPAFTETIKAFVEAKKSKKALGDWKTWMVKPKKVGSAYALCYNKAIESEYWWFTSSSSPLPFCRNTAYNPAGAFNGQRQVIEWKGFECDCQPGNKREELISKVRVSLTCNVEDPCEALACDKLGEGWICDKKQARCVCDASQGYAERIGEHSFCTRDECTHADVNGPMTVANIQHRSMIKCNFETKKWIPIKGYDFVRNVTSNILIGLKDINECLDENYCCNRKKAQCSSHGGQNPCKMQCENFDGGAACYCDTNKLDVAIDRDTCQCIPKCAVNSAWYLTCDGSDVKCNDKLFQQLSEAPTAPKGSICSRLLDENGKYITFSNILEMVKEVCDKKFYCLQPPEAIDDIRKHPAFNYEGQCIVHKDQFDKIKCPFGEKPEMFDTFVISGYCPYKFDNTKWPPLNPEYQKRDGVSMPLNCLPNGMKLNKNVVFLRDTNHYTMEAV